MKPKTAEVLRSLAAECRAKAEKASRTANHAGDNAPESFVTGRSGRSRSMDKRTDRAMDKTIKYSKIAVYWRERAATLEMQARYIEDAPRRSARVVIKVKREKIPMEERLFIGVYPTGLVYADRGREVHGDYKRLGYLNYGTLILNLEPDCLPALAEQIKDNAAKMQVKHGQPFKRAMWDESPIILGDGKLH